MKTSKTIIKIVNILKACDIIKYVEIMKTVLEAVKQINSLDRNLATIATKTEKLMELRENRAKTVK